MKIVIGVVGGIVVAIAAFAVFVFVGILRSTPSDATVRREFLARYPKATIKNIELIFEQDGQVVYLVTASEKPFGDGKYDFAIQRSNVDWAWCDDQTDRKCGPIAGE